MDSDVSHHKTEMLWRRTALFKDWIEAGRLGLKPIRTRYIGIGAGCIGVPLLLEMFQLGSSVAGAITKVLMSMAL